jgi:hypothetical protein
MQSDLLFGNFSNLKIFQEFREFFRTFSLLGPSPGCQLVCFSDAILNLNLKAQISNGKISEDHFYITKLFLFV